MKSLLSLIRLFCPVCGREFTPTDHRQKYCSRVCRVEVDKANMKRYRMRWKEELRGS